MQRRGRGRLAPTNGSVTRDDITAIYAEFRRGPEDLDPLTADEFLAYLLGAITDWAPSPRQRAEMSRRQRERWARERERQLTAHG